jgi:hypothetical protein
VEAIYKYSRINLDHVYQILLFLIFLHLLA